MNVNLVIIVIIVIIVLSFIVGLVLKRNYKKGLVLLNTTIIPSIGKERTIPSSQSNVDLTSVTQSVSPVEASSYVQQVSQPVSPVEVPSYVQQVSQPDSQIEVLSYTEQVSTSFDVPEEVLYYDQPVIISSMDVD